MNLTLLKEGYVRIGLNFNSAYSADKVGPPAGFPHCPLSKGEPYCLRRSHVVYRGSHSPLCPDRFTSSSMDKESLSPIGQTGTSLNVAPMLICFSHDYCLCFGN